MSFHGVAMSSSPLGRSPIMLLALLPSETAKVRFLRFSTPQRRNVATTPCFALCHSCILCHSCEGRSLFVSMLLPFNEIPAFASMTTGENRFDKKENMFTQIPQISQI